MKKLTLALLSLAAAASSLTAQETTYNVDPVHSYVFVRAIHFGAGQNYARFNKVSGSVVFNEADSSKSSVNIEVQAESVDTANAKRDEHLKSPDFLNAKQFPTITFKSTKVEKKADKLFAVTGDFTLRGQTKSITTEFRVIGFGKGPDGTALAGGEVMFKLKRSDFGVTFMVGPISDEVEVLVAIEGKAAKK